MEAFKVTKIIAKSEHYKYPKSYYLELQHLIHFDYHYLLVATSTYPMQCTRVMAIHCSMLHVPCHFVSFFPFGNAVRKCRKNATNLFMNDLWKFRKFTISSISCFGNIKKVWLKDWKMSLYKPGQVRACFYWIIEKS